MKSASMESAPMEPPAEESMTDPSVVAIIILNYNGVHFLEQFLPSVVAHSQGHRIIVADNASTDDSLDFLRRHYPTVEIIEFTENYGFAHGYDLALQQIENTYSVLLNSDVEVTSGWIDPVLKLMEADETIAACQPKVRSYHKKNYFEHAGAAGGYIDMLGYPFCRGRILDILEEDRGQYDTVIPIFWATGACFFVRTKVYNDLGGFDADFYAHMEEIDLCWRMNRAGYKLFCQPASVIYHVGGGTMPATNPRKTYLNFRNSMVMLYKNEQKRKLIWKLPLKLWLDWVAVLHFMLIGKRKDAEAVLRAMSDFLKHIKRWERSKLPVLSASETFSFVIMRKLLILERYLRRKKYFCELTFAKELSSTKWDYGAFEDDAGNSSRKQYQGTAKWESRMSRRMRK